MVEQTIENKVEDETEQFLFGDIEFISIENPLRKDIIRVPKSKKKANKKEEKKILRSEHRKQRKKQSIKENALERKKFLCSLTTEERITFIRNERAEEVKIKEKMNKALITVHRRVYIDLAYEEYMSKSELQSLVNQVSYTLHKMRNIPNPWGIHLTNFKPGRTRDLFLKMGAQNWLINIHEESLEELNFSHDSFVYLSPDSPNVFREEKYIEGNEVDQNISLVIGGLVDKTVLKDLSLNRANHLGIRHATLPISKWIKSTKTSLSIDVVILIVSNYLATSDWKIALETTIPDRLIMEESV